MYETAALKPFDEDKDQEDWPLLELTDATVYKYKRGEAGELVDLLDVQDKGPYRIKGTLSRVGADLEDIVIPKVASKIYETPLILVKVMTYSIEQFEDGEVKIWALGRCGWYSIVPSQEYKPIFKVMVEKGKLWCFLQDKYCEKYTGKGKNIPGSVDDLFAEYAKQEPTCSNARVAAQLFEKHHRYLLFEMCGVRADTEMWARTPLFRYWSSEYRSEISRIKRTTACGGAPSQKEDSPLVKEEPLTTPSPPSTPVARSKVHCRSNSYQMWLHIFHHIKDLEPSEVTKDRVVDIVNKVYHFDTLEHARTNVHARATDFLSLMEQPPYSMSYDWLKTPAYTELGFVRTSESDQAEKLKKLVQRVSSSEIEVIGVGARAPTIVRASLETPVNNPTLIEEGDDEDDNSEKGTNTRRHHSQKGKSVLRPVCTPAPLEVPSPTKSIDDEPDTTPTAFLLNRKRASNGNTIPAAKRTRTRGNAAMPCSLTAYSTTTTMTTTTTHIISTDTARRHRPTISTPRSQILGANRPGGHWECDVVGCKHSILDANKAENLRLIEQHYEEHGRMMEQAMEAIGGEILPSRPRHHVDNLLAKIEEMAKKWAMSKPAPLTSLELGLPDRGGST